MDTLPENASFKENLELVLKAQNGDKEARNEVLVRNSRLIGSIAKRLCHRGLAFEDLVQEGSFGLMDAIERFDSSLKVPFANYASIWIRSAMERAIKSGSRTVRISERLESDLYRLQRISNQLALRLKHTPSVEELASVSGYSIKKVEKLLKLAENTISIDGLEACQLQKMEHNLSCEDQSIDEQFATDFTLQKFRELLYQCDLKQQQLEVLLLRYGFYGNIMTQPEIAKKIGVSTQRVHQIECEAIRNLRCHSSIKEYAILMDNPTKSMERIDLHREQYKNYLSIASGTMKLLSEEEILQKLQKKKKRKVKTR